MVIDLDPASQLSGALKYCRERLSGRRSVHVITPEGNLLGDVGRTTCWYFANGLQVAADPITEIKFKDWVARFGKATTQNIEKIASGCSGPVSIIALCEHSGRVVLVRKLIEDMVSNFGDRATCVAITGAVDDWKTLVSYKPSLYKI